jgi:hypothetical protein
LLLAVAHCGSSGSSSSRDAGSTLHDGEARTHDASHEGSSVAHEAGHPAADARTPADARGDAPAPDSTAPGAGFLVTPDFFGMHLNVLPPKVTFGVQRLWDADDAWALLSASGGPYDWTKVQTHVTAANTYHFDLLYTFGRTPVWASSNPTDSVCNYSPGQCDPPVDVSARDDAGAGAEADGGADSDEHVKSFWTQFMNGPLCTGVAPNKTCGPIKYFELWNEPNADAFWQGNYHQLAKMSSDATYIIKHACQSCIVMTSDVSCGGDGYHGLPDPNLDGGHDSGVCDAWMAGYLTEWQKLGNLPDAGAWHPYPSHTNITPVPFPETNVSNGNSACSGTPNSSCRYSIVDQISRMRQVFDDHGLAGKPMYATEGSWLDPTHLPVVAQQEAWLARYYLILAASGKVTTVFWYAQDTASAAPLYSIDAGALTAAGKAYGVVYGWLNGATLQPCNVTGTVWTCALTQAGKPELVVWDASDTVLDGSTHAFSVTGGYTHQDDLDGNAASITGGSVAIGMKPIRLL